VESDGDMKVEVKVETDGGKTRLKVMYGGK
jgi:hypothetical protein